ncbi:MAG: V-type ATP synthase subunit E family protein, partial [Clostridia bacterium]|nr:V-type ATP synthase subunit E family protein [Clostridia bacterium]
DILERSRTNAELDSRKYALKAKRDVVESAFTAAYDGLCALQGQERDSLLKAMAVREALGGETVAAAPGDVDAMKRLLGEINAELAKAHKAELKMGNAAENIGGGFLLQGEGFEKNCSFEAMLRDAREAEESKVAQILFG